MKLHIIQYVVPHIIYRALKEDSMQQTRNEHIIYIYPFNNPKNNEKFHLAIIFSIKIYVSVVFVCYCQFDPLRVEYFDQLTSK